MNKAKATKANIVIDDESRQITLEGNIDQSQVPQLWKSRQQLTKDQVYDLNLDKLNHIDSAGLALLVNLLVLQRKQQGDIKLTKATPQLEQLIALTELEALFNYH